MATRRDTAMTAVGVLTSFHHDGYDMRRIFVLPTSWAGWGLFIAFVALVLAGIWPVIGWVNRATLVMGLPLLVVMSRELLYEQPRIILGKIVLF